MAKKILKEEILKDEQLNQVAGGTIAESFDDADRFEALGFHVYCNDPGVPLNDLYTETMLTLQDTYGKFGVKAITYGDDHRANSYFVDGKEVSREDAWKHIYAQFKK
ncbi:MAG: hypothetical protein IKD73_08360 [Selenomonadaceae bacterium]|nr:hypothetical protein [Selenomonadaceae bacterium]